MDRFDYLKRQADPAFDRLAQVGEGGFARLSERDQTIVAVWALLGEVGNGGFPQFFYNTSGDWAVETVEALERIGAEQAARIVRAANSDFPRGRPSSDFEERHEQIEALPDDDELAEKWDRLGTELCGIDQDVNERLYQYLIRVGR